MPKPRIALAISLLLASLAFTGQVALGQSPTKKLIPKVFDAEFQKEAMKVALDSPMAIYRTPIRGQFLYNQTVRIFGQLAIGRPGISGRGLISVEGSLSRSDRIQFLEKQVLCPRGKFIVKSLNPSRPVLEVGDVNIRYQLDSQMAYITPVGEEEFIEFPNHHYVLGFHEFSWPFTQMDITVNSKLDSLGKPYPIHVRSTSIEHKGLAFNGTSFNYTFAEDKIQMGGVKEIELRDITVMPADGKVTIMPDGTLDTLYNALVRFNSPQPHMAAESHGDIVIQSRDHYSGLGSYEFVNYKGERFNMEIKDANLAGLAGSTNRPDLEAASISLYIPTDSAREIIPGFLYSGLVRLSSANSGFDFNGRIAVNLPESRSHNFPYEGVGGKEIMVEKDMRLADRYVLQNGLYLGNDDGKLYTLFMEKDGHEGAFHLIEGYGELSFNPESNRYTMHHQQMNRIGLMQEQYYSYNPSSKTADFSGAIALNQNSSDIVVNSSAMGKYNSSEQELNCRTAIEISFRSNRRAFDILSKPFVPFDPITYVDDPKPLYQNLRYFIPKEDMDILEKTVGNEWNLLSFFVNSIVLADIELHWSESQQAFYSKGEIAVSNFFKSNINSRTEGFVYIPMKNRKDELHFYLKGKGDSWMYFKRQGNQISLYSSNQELNEYFSKKDEIVHSLPEEEALKWIEDFKKNFPAVN